MYGGADHQGDIDEDLAKQSLFEDEADMAQGMFTTKEVEETMKAFNF